MNKSESVKQIFAALVKAQEELKNSFKSATNPHYKSKYAPLDEIINGIKPVLSKHGLAITQDVSGDGDRVTVSTLIMHESGEWIEQTGLTIKPAKTDAQGTCGAVTYARRYALQAALNISSDDDDDGNEASKPAEKVKGIVNNAIEAIDKTDTAEKLKNIELALDTREWTAQEKIELAKTIKNKRTAMGW